MQKQLIFNDNSLDGTTVTPCVILPNQHISSELYDEGRDPNNVYITTQESGFMDSTIFESWLDRYFIPELRAKRKRYNYYGTTYLIMDGFTAHKVIEKPKYEADNFQVIWLPAHASHLVQPLDFGFFLNQKLMSAGYVRAPMGDKNKLLKQITRHLKGQFNAMNPESIVSAFRQAGIISKYNYTIEIRTKKIDRSVADGIQPDPMLIVQRSIIYSEVFSVVPHGRFTVVKQDNAFMTIALFSKWWTDIFIPHLRKKTALNYTGKTVLILDGFRAHHAVLDTADLASDNIKVVYLPPHSSDQTQLWDLQTFSLEKRIAKKQSFCTTSI